MYVDSIFVISIVGQDTIPKTYYNSQLSQSQAKQPDSGTILSLTFPVYGEKGDQVAIVYTVYSAGFPILTKETSFGYTDDKPGHSVLNVNEPIVALLNEYKELALTTANKEVLFDSLLMVHITTESDSNAQELVSSYLDQPGVDSAALAVKVRNELLKIYNAETAGQILTTRFPEGSDPQGLIARVDPVINPSSSTQIPVSSQISVPVSSGALSSSNLSSVHVSSSILLSSSSTIGSSSTQIPPVSSGVTVTPVPENSAALCADGFDNDGNSLIDCADPSCSTVSVCTTVVAVSEKCGDTLDNDNDGLVDCADIVDCAADAACTALSSSSVSSSSVSSSDIVISAENTGALCQDGKDNDGDGAIDCNDTECSTLTECQISVAETGAFCSDVIDNDRDGYIDCEDSDCATDSFCSVSSSSGSSSSALPTEGTIQFTCDPDGACTHKSTETLLVGESVTKTAAAVTGYSFKLWGVVGSGITKTNPEDSDFETITIKLDNSKGGEVRAKFEPKTYSVVLGNIEHGSVSVNNTPVQSVFTIEYGVQYQIEAIAESGWTFENWNTPTTLNMGSATDGGTTIAKSGVTPSGSIVLTPTFVGSQYQGSVTIDSMFTAGVSCPDGRSPTSPTNCGWGSGHVEINDVEVDNITFTNGSTVTLTAVPKMGNRFKEWSIDPAIDATVNGTSVTINGMGQDATIHAVFDSLTVGTVAETSNPSKTYTWKRYGNQIWMTENLNVVPGSGSLCYQSDCDTYGRYYKYSSAKTVCEELDGNWLLPNHAAWGKFEIHIGLDAGVVDDMGYRGGTDFGKRIASISSYWPNNVTGNNTEGFSAEPFGYYESNQTISWFGENAMFLTNTPVGTNVKTRDVSSSYDGIGNYEDGQNKYFNIRCVLEY